MTAPKKADPSLMEFAQANSRPDCVVCVLPQREEVDYAYRQGVARRQILRWLWEVKGYSGTSLFDETGTPIGLSATALDKHLTGQHHLKP